MNYPYRCLQLPFVPGSQPFYGPSSPNKHVLPPPPEPWVMDLAIASHGSRFDVARVESPIFETWLRLLAFFQVSPTISFRNFFTELQSESNFFSLASGSFLPEYTRRVNPECTVCVSGYSRIFRSIWAREICEVTSALMCRLSSSGYQSTPT